MSITLRLKRALDARDIPYELVPHRPAYTAPAAAQETRTPGDEFAKVVVVWADGQYAMAVMPAHHHVRLAELRREMNARDIRLASEDEIARLCPDCEVGAEPPLGNLYGLPVFLSSWLTGDERITFHGGTHRDAIRMRLQDYMNVVRPKVIDFSTLH